MQNGQSFLRCVHLILGKGGLLEANGGEIQKVYIDLNPLENRQLVG